MFLIVKNLNVPLILGIPAIDHFYKTIEVADRKYIFREVLVPNERGIVKRRRILDPSIESWLYTTDTTTIPPCNQKAVRVRFNSELIRNTKDRCLLIEPEIIYARHGYPVTLIFPPHVQDGHTNMIGYYTLLVQNPTSRNVTLPPNTIIGVARLVGEVMDNMAELSKPRQDLDEMSALDYLMAPLRISGETPEAGSTGNSLLGSSTLKVSSSQH
jgi:hypothetical protein